MNFFLGLLFYNIILSMAFLLGWPYLLFAGFVLGDEKWRQRCGLVPQMQGNPIWFHASSMGEAALIPPLIEALKKEIPEYKPTISTMTGTGRKLASKINQGLTAFFLPLDFIFSVLLSLYRIRPSALVLMETELWPNLIWLCYAKRIPVFIVNARLSDKSLPYYRFFGFLFRPLLNHLDGIICQSPEDAKKYRSIGVHSEKIINAGNIKYDTISKPVSSERKLQLRIEFGFLPEDLILVAGSTREGEEEIILAAWAKVSDQMKLIIAPRHPERFPAVEKILSDRNIPYSQRSQMNGTAKSQKVFLLDSMGELVDAYAAGDVALVGGSLVPVGGHNPLEPAALGLPVIFGPYMFNAQESAQSLLKHNAAIQTLTVDDLNEILQELSSNVQKRQAYGARAKAVVEGKRGTSEYAAGVIAGKIKKNHFNS